MGLSIIMGNMFSGKTSELIRRLKRLKIIGKRIMVINSAKDTRSPDEVLKTHDNVQFNCFKTFMLSDLEGTRAFAEAEVIAIDEAQFFTGLRVFIDTCLRLGKSVIAAGLDADAFQRKFGELLDCIPIASDVSKLSALCMHCKDGTAGPFTKRTVDSTELELIGGSDMYIATCGAHLK